MKRRLLTLMFAFLFVICSLGGALASPASTALAADPAAPSTGPIQTLLSNLAVAEQGSISGQVKDGRNDSVQGADIVLLLGGDIVTSTTTDPEGRFSLTANAGTYNLTISKSDIVTRTFQVEVIGGMDVDLGEVSVDLVPSSTWILIDVVIVVGAVGLFLVGRRNQMRAKK